MIIENDESKFANWTRFTLTLSAICTISILGWVLWSCRYGIDFADEGLYLTSIADPGKYGATISQFGFIYHPIYTLLHGSIAALRQFNVLITFSLAWILVNFTLQLFLEGKGLDKIIRHIVAAAFATACLVFLRLWIPTPSYNWLAFQALLISLIGLIFIQRSDNFVSAAGCVLLGVGGWLSFMAKPTTAAALAFFSLLYLIISKKLSLRILIITSLVSISLLYFSAFIIDGSVLRFIYRLKEGVKLSNLSNTGHDISDIFRIDNFYFDKRGKITLGVSTLIFFLTARFSVSKNKIERFIGNSLVIIFTSIILLVSFGFYHKTLHAGEPFQPLMLWSLPFTMVLVGISFYQLAGFLQISRSQWSLVLFFLISPYVFAFGTSNNYWMLGGLVGIFWVLSGFVFFTPIASRRDLPVLFLVFGFATQMMTVMQVLSGIEGPYYQPQPLYRDHDEVRLRGEMTTLELPNSFGQYITNAINIANRAGFTTGTPMIDLTGHSPGVLFALGASNTGQAWLYGNFPNDSGYRGGDKVAAKVLGEVSCGEASSAWILAEPGGPVSISPTVLSSFGANIETDFKVVGSFKTAKYVGGFPTIQTQEILKPTRSFDVAMSACAASRASHS